jgi:DNA-binding LytR/AlgR family response regulator
MKTKNKKVTDLKVHVGSRKYIDPQDIFLLESELNYTHIFLRSGEKILSSTTLKIIENRLMPFTAFVRVNRQCIVNLDLALTHDREVCILPNMKEVYYSRRRAKLYFG